MKSSKKKILFIIESLSGGGAEKILTTLVQNINKESFDVTVCSIVDFGLYTEKIKQFAKYFYIIPNAAQSKSLFFRLYYSILYKLVYHLLPLKVVYSLFIPQKFDIEIAFVEGFATKLLSHSNNKKSQKIAWVHTDLINNHWISTIYKNKQEEKNLYSIFDNIIGVSDQVTNSVRTLYSLPQTTTLHNPIDVDDIILKSNEIIDLSHKTHKYRLITLGRLVPQKGYDRLLHVINKLITKDNLNLELWILGDGPERDTLEEYAKHKKLTSNVSFLGFHKNPYPFMLQSDIFVCSSRSEGYSTAATEAIILGLPVITTDCSGMSELLGPDNKYGIITNNDEESLYEGIKMMITNENNITHYKEMAKLRAKDFSMEKQMRPIENLLKQ